MSAFVGILSEQIVYIGTDTLARGGYQSGDTCLRVSHFTAKTFHVLHFKAVFASVGYQEIAFEFYRFINKHCIGIDINSLTNINPQEFKKYLAKQYDEILTGTIFLYGLDVKLQKFKGYWLPVNKPGEIMTWRPMQYINEGGFCMSPMVEEPYDKVDAIDDEKSLIEGDGNADFITKLIRIQREEDGRRHLSEQAGIGGEVILTRMGLTKENKFFIDSTITYEFPDRMVQGEQMMMNSKEWLNDNTEVLRK